MTTTDGTRGLPLRERVERRVAELEQALGEAETDRSRQNIELALATARSLTTGDVAHPSDVVGSQLNDWLERNKHIGIKATEDRARSAKPSRHRSAKHDGEDEAAEGKPATRAKPPHDGEETRSE